MVQDELIFFMEYIFKRDTSFVLALLWDPPCMGKCHQGKKYHCCRPLVLKVRKMFKVLSNIFHNSLKQVVSISL